MSSDASVVTKAFFLSLTLKQKSLKMYKLFIVTLCVAGVFADPADIKILRQAQVVNPDGSFQYIFETENGIFAQQQGVPKQNGNEVSNSVVGSYAYTSPDGTPIQTQYVADENGYRAEGNAIPPIPQAIARSLEWNAAHPEEEEGNQKYPVRINY